MEKRFLCKCLFEDGFLVVRDLCVFLQLVEVS
jgi:hypothetical protein